MLGAWSSCVYLTLTSINNQTHDVVKIRHRLRGLRRPASVGEDLGVCPAVSTMIASGVGGLLRNLNMSPRYLMALCKLVEALDKHRVGSRYLLALATIAAVTLVALKH